MPPGVDPSELLLIAIVALVVVGPRELPKLARKVTGFIRNARGLAKDFQKSFDEMGRAIELEDLRREIDSLKRGGPVADVQKELEGFQRDLRTVEQKTRAELARQPGAPTPPAASATVTPITAAAPAAPAEPTIAAPQPAAAEPAPEAAPPSEDAPQDARKAGGA